MHGLRVPISIRQAWAFGGGHHPARVGRGGAKKCVRNGPKWSKMVQDDVIRCCCTRSMSRKKAPWLVMIGGFFDLKTRIGHDCIGMIASDCTGQHPTGMVHFALRRASHTVCVRAGGGGGGGGLCSDAGNRSQNAVTGRVMHSHSTDPGMGTVTAQSQHSHSTVTAQSQSRADLNQRRCCRTPATPRCGSRAMPSAPHLRL